MNLHAHYLRWLYRGGHPHRFAQLQNRLSAMAYGAGVWPSRAAALDVVGRRSGRLITLPVVIADLNGDRYLVSMLGERANWVHNVRADNGRAILRHGVREAIDLEEVPVSDRGPIVQRYVQVAPGGRPHITVDRDAPLQDFERVAPEIPVFRINTHRPSSSQIASGSGVS